MAAAARMVNARFYTLLFSFLHGIIAAMNKALPVGRRDAIAARLAAGEAVVAADVARSYGVSEDAVRRDLRALAAAGLCRRVYGGALPLPPGMAPMAQRVGTGQAEKAALAIAGAALIGRGDFLFLDAGSTNLALAAALPEDHDLTIVTNAVDIAAAVLARGDCELIVVGGVVDPVVGAAVDGTALAAIGRMRFDRVFLGACAVDATEGLTVFSLADAAVKRALVAAGRAVAALITTDKLGGHAPHRIAACRALDALVVGADTTPATVAALTATGARVIIAGAADAG